MNKQYISYGLIGAVAGLVLGFLVANWTSTSAGTGPQANSNAPASASVNSSSQPGGLPPNHPPLNSGEVIPAGPLPAGAEAAAKTGVAPAASEEVTELPSLDPLPASSKEERTEQKYKNIQVLKGLPAERLESIMFAFKSALGVECTHCHVKDHFDKDDKAAKQLARKMITMTRNANAQLGGAARVTCYTCHRGQTRPPQ